MINSRIANVLLEHHVTEKASILRADSNQYVFKVTTDSNKKEIKDAVEKLFEVNVESVRIVNVKGKSKSFKLRAGKRSDWKKAYVRVQEDQVIDFLGGESV